MDIKTKRIYEVPVKADGFRMLVDRIWPRGMTKEKAKIDFWFRNVAPSDALRKWFSHDLTRCKEFRIRYLKELKTKEGLVERILEQAKKPVLTLLYGAKEGKCNNATVLKEYLGEICDFQAKERPKRNKTSIFRVDSLCSTGYMQGTI